MKIETNRLKISAFNQNFAVKLGFSLLNLMMNDNWKEGTKI